MIHIPILRPNLDSSLKAGLVSVWEFNEISGSTSLDSHSSNDGIIHGAAINQVGVLDKCYKLDGYGDYIEYGEYNNPDWSISLWFKTISTSTTSDTHGLVSKALNTQASSQEVTVRFNTNGSLYSLIGNGVSIAAYNTTESYYDAQWHHYALSYNDNSSEGYIYIDNVYKYTLAIDHSPKLGAEWELGRFSESSQFDRYFNGYIDQFGLWSKSLSASHISTLYNLGNGLAYSNW